MSHFYFLSEFPIKRRWGTEDGEPFDLNTKSQRHSRRVYIKNVMKTLALCIKLDWKGPVLDSIA